MFYKNRIEELECENRRLAHSLAGQSAQISIMQQTISRLVDDVNCLIGKKVTCSGPIRKAAAHWELDALMKHLNLEFYNTPATNGIRKREAA